MNQVKTLAAAVTKDLIIPEYLPTSNDTNSRDWKLATSSLSCGLNEMQGWSSGIGINSSEKDFEKKLALLTYWSANQDQFKGKKWFQQTVQGPSWGPIGVGRYLRQFLWANQNYLHSSEEKWITRFENFVKENDLGTYTKTGSFYNPNYAGHTIQVAVWTWNGKYPADVLRFIGG